MSLTINPAYSFVQYMAREFDKQVFPETVSKTGGLRKDETGGAFEAAKVIDSLPLPTELKIHVLSYTADNLQNWLHQTRQLKLDSEGTLGYGSFSASDMRKKMGLKKNKPNMNALQSVWDEVFSVVYAKEGLKREVINLATAVNPQVMGTTGRSLKLFQVAHKVGTFFNNKMVMLIAWFIVLHYINTKLEGIFQKFKLLYIPRSVNKVINHVPRPIMRQLNRLYGACETLYAWKFRIWIGAVVIRCTVGLFFPRVGYFAKKVVDIIYLPRMVTKLPWTLAWKIAGYSYNTQSALSLYVANQSVENIQNALDDGGQRAYAVWMNLMKKAWTKGIPIRA